MRASSKARKSGYYALDALCRLLVKFKISSAKDDDLAPDEGRAWREYMHKHLPADKRGGPK
jgi:hypothetical protein